MAKPGFIVGTNVVAGTASPKCRAHTWLNAGTSWMSARYTCAFTTLASDAPAFERDATVQAADIHLALGSAERAKATIDRIQTPTEGGAASYHTVRGRILAALNDDGAQEEFNRAKSADPKYAPAYLEAGLLYVRREALPQGLRELETYLELVGEDASSPQVAQIRELTNQLRQTAGQPRPATGV